MNKQVEIEDNKFLRKFLDKYEFIEGIYVTDSEGYLMMISSKNNIDNSEELKKKIIQGLYYCLSNSLNHHTKTEKWNTKGIISFFDNYAIYQRKISKSINCNIVCNLKNYSHEILGFICEKIKGKLEIAEDKIEKIKAENGKE